MLCCYGQGVEENKEHHHPVKGFGFHIHEALHPEETIPATGQTTTHTHTQTLGYCAKVLSYVHDCVYKAANSLVVYDSTLALQVVQAICI